MRQLLYVSNTTQEIGLSDLDNVLTASRRNNAMMGITGLLLFIDGGRSESLFEGLCLANSLLARFHP